MFKRLIRCLCSSNSKYSNSHSKTSNYSLSSGERPRKEWVRRLCLSPAHRDLVAWLEEMEQVTINRIVNCDNSKEDILELKGRLKAYHRVLTTINVTVKEQNDAE